MERDKSPKRRRCEEENQMDRLSNLPDNLIHHILSLMDVKYAVQSCILSKRWENQWKHISTLNLNNKSMETMAAYKSLVSNVLDNLKATKISGLHFQHHGEDAIGKSFFRKVAKFAVARNVEKVELLFTGTKLLFNFDQLPSSFLKCQSLKVLKISGHGCDFPQRSLEWSSLTTLSLSKMILEENSSLDIFSKLPNLQNLSLENVISVSLEAFIISAPRLVYLTINNLDLWCPYGQSVLLIDAPRLKWFYFQGFQLLTLAMVNSPLLYKVDFGIRSAESADARNILDMIRQFGNALSLTISQEVIEVLSEHSGLLKKNPSPFVKLESLSVKLKGRNESLSISLPLMNFFLDGCPSSARLQMEFPKENSEDIE